MSGQSKIFDQAAELLQGMGNDLQKEYAVLIKSTAEQIVKDPNLDAAGREEHFKLLKRIKECAKKNDHAQALKIITQLNVNISQ